MKRIENKHLKNFLNSKNLEVLCWGNRFLSLKGDILDYYFLGPVVFPYVKRNYGFLALCDFFRKKKDLIKGYPIYF